MINLTKKDILQTGQDPTIPNMKAYKLKHTKKEFLKRFLLLSVPQKINLKDLNETIINYPSKNENE